MQIIMRTFARQDNPAIVPWFANPESQRWLESPWTSDELDQMATEPNGREYVAIIDDHVVGCVGCYIPTGEHQNFMLSGIHVDPKRRRRGIARYMVTWLLDIHGSNRLWNSMVDPRNAPMVSLFDKLGWGLLSEQVDSQGYLMYEWRT